MSRWHGWLCTATRARSRSLMRISWRTVGWIAETCVISSARSCPSSKKKRSRVAYQSGADPAAVLPVLATWMGHADPNDTYWYLTGTAELPAAATQRLRAHAARPEGRRS